MADVSHEKPKPHSAQTPDKPGWWWLKEFDWTDKAAIEVVGGGPDDLVFWFGGGWCRVSDVAVGHWRGRCAHMDTTRDAVIAVMREMDAKRRQSISKLELENDSMVACNLDGGAARLTWSIELLRQALDLPCGWETEGT